MDIIMNWAPSASTPLSLGGKVILLKERSHLFNICIPALFKETRQQTWLNIQQHIECIVSLYISKNCSEIWVNDLSGQEIYPSLDKQILKSRNIFSRNVLIHKLHDLKLYLRKPKDERLRWFAGWVSNILVFSRF